MGVARCVVPTPCQPSHARSGRCDKNPDANINRLAHLMDNTTFGLTMLLVGMGGTLLTLGILAVLIGWLTRLCQPRAKGDTHE